ncbi:MAG: site-specific integrase [Gammaproteobacteria bacterium]|jgi:site-specific recombinase XerD
MKAILTNTFVSKLEPSKRMYDVWDEKLTGFLVRVFASGAKSYLCYYRHEGIKKNVTIGSVELFTVSQAREKARIILGNVASGIFSDAEKKTKQVITLKNFIEQEYEPWRLSNRKDGKAEIDKIKTKFFEQFGCVPLNKIALLTVEKWRSKRLKNGISTSTVNRDISALKVVFSKALEWGFIEHNPIVKLKTLRADDSGIVRYLEVEEEIRLRQALDEREAGLRAARERSNEWRKDRGYSKWPGFQGDYLKPMVLLSLNTGIRKGELLNLIWEHINFKTKILMLPGSATKSAKKRYIPLNGEACEILKYWQMVSGRKRGLVFFNQEGKKFTDIKKSWISLRQAAKIKNFRWHDMRHHFASKLVMAGVDLNTVRELLGHADIKMTLRYAHLAPEHKARAVAKLKNPLIDY